MTVQIFFVEISSEQIFENDVFMKLVSNERRIKLEKFKFEIDCRLSLYAELLVRYQACKTLGLNNEEVVFGKNKNGKPYLQNHPGFLFNISHTRNAIAMAFANEEIGVDIEKIKSPDFKIAKRFFTSYEQDYILSHEYPERTFYEVWTKKEAHIKCVGTGLSTPLNSFNVLDVNNASMYYTIEIRDYIISIYLNKFAIKAPAIINMTESELQPLFLNIPTA